MKIWKFFRPKSVNQTPSPSSLKVLRWQLVSIGGPWINSLYISGPMMNTRISLTNFAVLSVLLKVLVTRTPTFVDWLLLLTVIASYRVKKWHEYRNEQHDSKLQLRLDAMDSSISQLKAAVTLKR